MKKLTYEYVKSFIESFVGYILLSKEYINVMTKLKIQCSEGHEFEMTFNNFKNLGQRCPTCAGNKNHTIDYVIICSKKRKYELLSTIYKNVDDKLKFKCPNGHEFEMSFYNFKKGQGCSKCSGKKKHILKDIKIDFEIENYDILSTKYINNNTKLKLKCPNGHICEISYSNFKSGYRCRLCWLEFNKGPNHCNYNPNRSELDLNDRLRHKRSESWKKKNMTQDPNYNDWLKNPDNYELDHIIPVKLFCELCTRFDLSEEKIKKAINKKENYQLLLKNENRQKSYRGSSLFEAVNYLLNHGFLFEDFNEPSYGNLTITETDGIISLS